MPVPTLEMVLGPLLVPARRAKGFPGSALRPPGSSGTGPASRVPKGPGLRRAQLKQTPPLSSLLQFRPAGPAAEGD